MNELLLFLAFIFLSGSGMLIVLIHEAHKVEKEGFVSGSDMTLSEFGKRIVFSFKKTVMSFRDGNIVTSGALSGHDKLKQPIHRLQKYTQGKLSPLINFIMGRIKISRGDSSEFLRDISPEGIRNKKGDTIGTEKS